SGDRKINSCNNSWRPSRCPSHGFKHEGMVEIACNIEALELVYSCKVSLSDDGKFQHTSAEQIETRVKELAGKVGVNTFGSKIVGFTPEDVYLRAQNALLQGNADAWRSVAYNMRM
ncbi:hypothetical protein QZH41_010989, partial [Actinostola sp. cb2023]